MKLINHNDLNLPDLFVWMLFYDTLIEQFFSYTCITVILVSYHFYWSIYGNPTTMSSKKGKAISTISVSYLGWTLRAATLSVRMMAYYHTVLNIPTLNVYGRRGICL